MIANPSATGADRPRCLVLGIGNRLLQDDAAGPLVIDRLAALALPGVQLLDGGTMGLSLLPDIEACEVLIVVDAARLQAEPGTVKVFEDVAMDAQAMGRKQTVHEVALADLLGAAALQGLLPPRRALVAVEPASTALGLGPTPAVLTALPQMVAHVQGLLVRLATEVVA